jgi:hypothetical protein
MSPRNAMTNVFRLWEQIFTTKQFDLTQDLHFITADEIKAITHAEPRIMAKMDSSRDLPDVFRRNGYFLLPVKNGRYAIVRGQGFHRLEDKAPAADDYTSRIKFHLTTAGRGSGEMQYLDYSFNSGALENLLGIAPLYQSIRGREFSREFKFRVNKSDIDVTSVQLEVDSGLEGENAIVLIEAKINTPEDFIIRQLFYPYSHFRMMSFQKTIIPMFFTYEPASKVYNFWIYEFTDPSDYNSIRLKSARSLHIVTEHEIALSDIKPKGIVPYKDLIPQANDLNKVIELAFKVTEGFNDYRNIAHYFKFDDRQSSYYREAAEAIGLVTSENGKYKLTEIGQQFVRLPAERRNLFVAELLSDFTLVRECLDILKGRGNLNKADLEVLIARHSKLSGSTIPRRAGSLASWLRWMAGVTGSFVVDENGFRARA